MRSLASIQDQLITSTFFTRMALKDLSEEQWEITPPALGTHVNWQFGHILLAKYHFGVELISGPNAGIFDVDLFKRCYDRGSDPCASAAYRPRKAALLEAAQNLDAALMHIIGGMDEADLAAPVKTFLPVVQSKHAALLFCGSHQMYHNGQLALVRKALLAA
jgi:uncharacterized damage-inducible protein DinB